MLPWDRPINSLDFAYRSAYFEACQLSKSAFLTSKIFTLNCRLHAISEHLWLKKGRKLFSDFVPASQVCCFCCSSNRIHNVGRHSICCSRRILCHHYLSMDQRCWFFKKSKIWWGLFRKFYVLKIPTVLKIWCSKIFNKYETQFYPQVSFSI